MCGISGIVHFDRSPLDERQVRAMMKAMKHRGPNDDGTFLEDNIGFGFVRLSIIDLATGHQPIANESGTVWTVFNGEIYNYVELAEEYQLKSKLSTGSDFEPLLHIYAQEGEKAFERLRGMYALAALNTRTGDLYLARDLAPVPEDERHERTHEEAGMPSRWVPLEELRSAVVLLAIVNLVRRGSVR